MKELTDVWKRKNKRTGKFQYVGAFSYQHKNNKTSELALITKGTYYYFRKNKNLMLNQKLSSKNKTSN